jgi:hypothetical protein
LFTAKEYFWDIIKWVGLAMSAEETPWLIGRFDCPASSRVARCFFLTQNPNWVYSGKPWNGKLGLFHVHSVCVFSYVVFVVAIWYIFGSLVYFFLVLV